MQPRRKSFLSTGITSIVLIFVLLCLLTFAVLSVVSARADYKLSEKNTTRTTEYYEAENTANDILLKISTVLSTHAGSSAYLDDVRTDLDGTDGISFSSASQLQYYVTINENQRLFVSLLLTNASSDTSSDTAGLYQIKAWKVENTHEWNNDTPVPVLGRPIRLPLQVQRFLYLTQRSLHLRIKWFYYESAPLLWQPAVSVPRISSFRSLQLSYPTHPVVPSNHSAMHSYPILPAFFLPGSHFQE